MALSNKVCTVCYLIKFRFHKAEDLAYGYTVQCRRIFFQELQKVVHHAENIWEKYYCDICIGFSNF